MSVREAAVNAVLHGNAYDPQKKITVAYETKPNSLAITITDQGKGLSEQDIPDPLAEENLLKTSGRGIFLIRRAASVRLSMTVRCGNRLNCWKTIPIRCRTAETSTPFAVISRK